jgi:hypothetical protein
MVLSIKFWGYPIFREIQSWDVRFLLRCSVLEGTDRDAQINLGMAGY